MLKYLQWIQRLYTTHSNLLILLRRGRPVIIKERKTTVRSLRQLLHKWLDYWLKNDIENEYGTYLKQGGAQDLHIWFCREKCKDVENLFYRHASRQFRCCKCVQVKLYRFKNSDTNNKYCNWNNSVGHNCTCDNSSG